MDALAPMVADLGAPGIVSFHRVAVTKEQIDRFALLAAPPKPGDKRGGWTDMTVQAEALTPDISQFLDLEAYEAILDVEEEERAELLTVIDSLEMSL